MRYNVIRKKDEVVEYSYIRKTIEQEDDIKSMLARAYDVFMIY